MLQISRHALASGFFGFPGSRTPGFVSKLNPDGISGRARLLPSPICPMPHQLIGSAGASPSRSLTKTIAFRLMR